MLALPTRRQQQSLPSPPPSQHQLAYQQLPQQLASNTVYDQKLLNDYLESQSSSSQYMTTAFNDFANPAIRIQQSTPTPQAPQTPLSASNMLNDAWMAFGNNMQSQQLQTPIQSQQRGHQRDSSSSSLGSTASPYQTVPPASNFQTFANNLPTPSHTPTQDSFLSGSNFANYSDSTVPVHMSMKQALMDQSDDVPEFAHSARHSVSSYGQDSPATPQTALGDDSDFKLPVNEVRPHAVPKFERTYTDIAADNFYDPAAVAAQTLPQTKPAQPSLLSPFRSTDNVHRALQAAQMARSQSPSSSASRGDSPFRRGSPYRQASSNYTSPMMATAAASREQNRQVDASYAMKSQLRSTDNTEPKTISPKEAMLVYPEPDEDAKASLFPDSSANELDSSQLSTGSHYSGAVQPAYDMATAQILRQDNWPAAQFATSFPTSMASSIPPTSAFNFVTPSVQSSLQALPSGSTASYQPMTNTVNVPVDPTPEFPAHLTSMESSASEADPPSGSQSSDRYLHKPGPSTSDHGTYSCTYHGCSQRFETPQKLQKHKREGHRNTNLGATLTSAAILERNSQAGPHKCERINPTTGKPCNTIFSRPYDLTRHEDTIHNARKQKVRCALCVEEKTFSRNDALTRHMRVVHPEVDFPGKHRRRGGNHD